MSISLPISIVMPVHNGELFLRPAIDSILSQTCQNFEFIVVDNGSTDSTPDILRSYGSRLRVYTQAKEGLVHALNTGLALARGDYIARMDADDVAEPERLERQLIFLQNNPEVGLLGSVYRFIDEKDRIFGAQPMLTDDLHIRWRMLLVNPFAHPTVMIRREVLKQNDLRYSETAQAVEDYDLWTRMLNYTKGANLNEPLLRYRIHHKSVTSQFSEIQCRNFDAIALRTIREQLPGFVIAPEQAHQLCEVLGRGRETAPGLDLRRPALAELYLDMWAAFAQRYRGHPQLKAVQRQAVLRIAWLVWLPPLRPGWWRVMRRLLHIDPYLPGRALISAPNAVFSRLRRLALEQKRF